MELFKIISISVSMVGIACLLYFIIKLFTITKKSKNILLEISQHKESIDNQKIKNKIILEYNISTSKQLYDYYVLLSRNESNIRHYDISLRIIESQYIELEHFYLQNYGRFHTNYMEKIRKEKNN